MEPAEPHNTAPDGVPTDQHTVSKTVLRQFCRHGKLLRFDLDHGCRRYVRTPDQVGYTNEFVSAQHHATEQLWKPAEDAFPGALAAVRDESWKRRPDVIEKLKRLVVVHYVRNRALTRWEEAAHPVLKQSVIDELLQGHPQRALYGFVEAMGRLPADTDELTDWLSGLTDDAEFLSGLPFVERLQHSLDWMSRWAAPLTLQVARATAGEAFLISDSPAVPLGKDVTRSGYGKVAAGDSRGLVMPIAPDVVICIADNAAVADFDTNSVRQINMTQVHNAVSDVYAHPGYDPHLWLASVLPYRFNASLPRP